MELSPQDQYNKQLADRVHPEHWETKPNPDGYDFIAIGGGTAAQIATAGAALLGLKVALIEKQFIGGDCLMAGCVPSKSLIHAAKRAYQISNSSDLGINVEGMKVDFPKVMETLRKSRAEISHDDSAETVSARGVDVLFGHARFSSKNSLDLNGQEVRFKRAIICTGSRPVIPNIPGLAEAEPLTNESVFNLTELPSRLAIIGGGAIGCELGQAFGRLGAQVSMIVRGERVLKSDDPEASSWIESTFRDEGIDLRLSTTVKSVDQTETGYRLNLQGGSGELEVDRILVAAGRVPNVDDLGLEAAGINVGENGIVVDDYQRTSNKRVYAAGDVANKLKFTHSAYAYGEYAAMNALMPMRFFKSSKRVIPWCTYVDPEVAHVGWSYEKLMDNEAKWVCYQKPFSHNDRAQVERNTKGFSKLYASKKSGKLVAATVVGEHAGDLIGEMSLAITTGKKLADIGNTVHPYPTRSEIYRLAVEDYKSTLVTPLMKSLARLWFKFVK